MLRTETCRDCKILNVSYSDDDYDDLKLYRDDPDPLLSRNLADDEGEGDIGPGRRKLWSFLSNLFMVGSSGD